VIHELVPDSLSAVSRQYRPAHHGVNQPVIDVMASPLNLRHADRGRADLCYGSRLAVRRVKRHHLIQMIRIHLPGRDHGLMDLARSYLRDADPVLARLIDDRPDLDPRAWMSQLPRMDLFGALLFQVTGQQLSVAATRRTLTRIQALFGGHLPAPAELLGVGPD
jgi:hypothetical protein